MAWFSPYLYSFLYDFTRASRHATPYRIVKERYNKKKVSHETTASSMLFYSLTEDYLLRLAPTPLARLLAF